MRHPSRALFACWLVVVATNTVVTHRHAAARGHTHGLGWTHLPVTVPSEDLLTGHRHFVLFGVEFGATSCEPDDTAPDSPCVGPVADSPAPACDTVLAVPTGIDAVTPPTELPALPTSAPVRTAGTSRALNSCPLTSFSRSGVLRT